jgi:hypothetical protein
MSDELQIMREFFITYRDKIILLKTEVDLSEESYEDKLGSVFEEMSNKFEGLADEYSTIQKFQKFNESILEYQNDEVIEILKNDFSKEEIEVILILFEIHTIFEIKGDEEEIYKKFTELFKLTKYLLYNQS